MNQFPEKQIRAVYDSDTIRVYQAYCDAIADEAIAACTFTSPSFKLNRMTWIKPSFLWMMYRAGWGYKDQDQRRILAIDITRAGFEWALAHSCPSNPPANMNAHEWSKHKNSFPVRIQWDPERNLLLQPLPYRTIQIGLSKEAVTLYINEWIRAITDVTAFAHHVRQLVLDGKLTEAEAIIPKEMHYPYPFESESLSDEPQRTSLD